MEKGKAGGESDLSNYQYLGYQGETGWGLSIAQVDQFF